MCRLHCLLFSLQEEAVQSSTDRVEVGEDAGMGEKSNITRLIFL